NSFAYYLQGKPASLERARAALVNISPTLPPLTPEGGEYNQGWGDWMQAAEALRNFSVAYDLLYQQLSPAERTKIENSLIAQTEQIYQHFSHFPSSFDKVDIATGLGIPKNNHIIDIAIGVLTVALVIDSERSNLWLEEALDQLGLGLSQILADGSYTEGGYYGQYVASRLFQFAFYYHNATGLNLHDIPRIAKFTEWLMELERSDESMPMWDDAQNVHYFYKPMAIGLSKESERLQQVFEANPENYFSASSRMIEAFCAYDNRVAASRELPQSKFYAEGGQLIFQNRSVQGLLLAEPENTLSKHDHIDHLSFTFSAFQHHFLIDSGYGPGGVNDPERNWFLSPEAHNIPLVNGFGPDQNPLWGDTKSSLISHNYLAKSLATAAVSSNYRETEIRRTAILPEANYMIILDELNSPAQQRFSIPWQGLGDFTIHQPNRASWRQAEAELQLEYISLVVGQIRPRLGLNSYSRQDNIHVSSEYALDITSSAQVVSLLLPSTGLQQLQSEVIFPQSQQAVSGRKIYDQQSTDYLILAESAWIYSDFASDAQFCFIQDNAELSLVLQAASWFEYRGQQIFSSSQKIDLVLQLEQNWRGAISSEDSVAVAFYPPRDPQVVFIDGKIRSYKYQNGAVHLAASGTQQFSFTQPRQKRSLEPARDYFPMLIKLQHNFYNDLSELSAWEKNQLRNEIMRYSAAAFAQDVEFAELWENIYGVGTGLLANSWDAEESFGLALPQKFELERRIFDQKISYKESGKISADGITPYYQSLIWEDKLYLSYQTPFSDYQLARADYYHQRGNILLQWQKYQRQDIVLQTRTNWQQVDYRFAAAIAEQHDNWQDIGFYARQNWLNIRLQQQETAQSYHVVSGWQRSKLAMRAELLHDQELQLLSLGQNIRFNQFNRWETGWNYQPQEQRFQSKYFNQTANSATLFDLQYIDKWRLGFYNRWELQNYSLQSRLQQDQDFFAELKLVSQQQRLNYELSLDSEQIFFASCHWAIDQAWALVLSQHYNYGNNIVEGLSCGTAIYAQNYYWLNLGFINAEEEYQPLAELVTTLYFSECNQLDLAIFSSWKERAWDELRLTIENKRADWSPGILLSYAEGNLQRAEGYISWYF
ncbi:MAG: heparinase II/III family protein, partial [Candidatus Cloacimonadales bacterium]